MSTSSKKSHLSYHIRKLNHNKTGEREIYVICKKVHMFLDKAFEKLSSHFHPHPCSPLFEFSDV